MDEHEGIWQQIRCDESDALLNGPGKGWAPISGRSDIGGQFGSPRVETIWGDRDTELPRLKTIRHPESGRIWQDRLPCEHFRWAPDDTVAEPVAPSIETSGR